MGIMRTRLHHVCKVFYREGRSHPILEHKLPGETYHLNDGHIPPDPIARPNIRPIVDRRRLQDLQMLG